jgi:hypothetical protein
MSDLKLGDFEMNDVVLEFCDYYTFVKIGRPEFSQDRFNEEFHILFDQISCVWAFRRQGKLRGYLPERHVLHHIVVEKFLNHLVKKKDEFIHRNGSNGPNCIAEKFVLCRKFGYKRVPAFLTE